MECIRVVHNSTYQNALDENKRAKLNYTILYYTKLNQTNRTKQNRTKQNKTKKTKEIR